MIQKAIIEEIVYGGYQARVRIPRYNKAASSPTATDTADLAIATICTFPGVHPSYQIGDIVFVGFENDRINQPVILGLLYRENMGSSMSDMVDVLLPSEQLSSVNNNYELSGNLSDININTNLDMKDYSILFSGDSEEQDVTKIARIHNSMFPSMLKVQADYIQFQSITDSNKGTYLQQVRQLTGLEDSTNSTSAATRGYVDGYTNVINTNGTITLVNHNVYNISNVDNITIVAGEGISAGVIQFNANTPKVTLSGFEHVDGNIVEAESNSYWEFNCWNKNIIFKLYEN